MTTRPFVIKGPVDIYGEQLYWSNVDGWTGRSGATLFYEPVERMPMEATGIEELP